MASFLVQAVGEKKAAARALSARALLFLDKLTAPVAADEDAQRRERILNIILVLSISCLAVLGATVVWNSFSLGDSYGGIDPFIFGGIIAFYGALLSMSKKGYGHAASILLIATDAAGTIYTGWQWGASLPATLLLTAVVIVTAGVLLGSTTGFIAAGGMIGVLTVLGVHEAVMLNIPDWRYDEITSTDVISYSALLLFMSFIGWLSNRQIGLSLLRARASEKLLAAERDLLERRVAERTEELVASQEKTVAGLEHSAHVGELSRGVFHDLLSPLSAIALYIEEMARTAEDRHGEGMRETHELVQRAVTASKRMGSFMDSVRRHIGRADMPAAAGGKADIRKEAGIVRDILAYKARMAGVRITIGRCDPILIAVHPVRIHQVFLNLVSNAIDACTGAADDKEEWSVHISAVKNGESATFVIADDGCGISPEQQEALFERPDTTKPQGTGIGLTTVRSIVEDELGGTIAVSSAPGLGTIFTIVIPLYTHGKRAPGKGPAIDT